MAYNRISMNRASGIYEFIADSTEDLQHLPSWCAMGSSCYIINEPSVYIKNGKRQWVQQQGLASSQQQSSGGGNVSFSNKIVNSLPAAGEIGVIYFVPNNNNEESNLYDEYIYINNKWEKLGVVEENLIPISVDSIDGYFS